ncbi:MAG: hypothetical protein EPN47_04845 [Acidobacteria bacterium]|nr:MAG: hypothetical protein EPN47_04845 [Acidobacteriota bacterium]
MAKGLLEGLVGRGLATDRKYLFVIDGSKALRVAINAAFGAENPVQRCRQHKLENVMGYLPEHLKDQTKAAMRAAFRLPGQGRDGAVGEAGGMAGTRISQRRHELARRFGGDVHGQSDGFVAEPLALSGIHQRD